MDIDATYKRKEKERKREAGLGVEDQTGIKCKRNKSLIKA